MFEKKHLQLHMYTCTFHEADTSRERRHVSGVRANTTVDDKATAISFGAPCDSDDKDKTVLTSVTMIPAIGPRKTV
jgi:hypothetical protein